ncbi:MAG TPA: membrane-targeted effector domain-containing toxin, partial [Dyella sp.]|uniref:membrane-targeted effector domain-containing toxin n=1 Tax=Dyella sp. TaxID=1869338 RepID=UPI002CB7DD28
MADTHAPPLEATDKETDKPHSPKPQVQSFSSTATDYAQKSSTVSRFGAPSNSLRTTRSAAGHAQAASDVQATDPAKVDQEQKNNEGLAASSQQVQAIIDRRPTFLQAVSWTLFPNIQLPIDLDSVWVNEYTEDYAGASNDYGGAAELKRNLHASHKLTDVLSEILTTGRIPSFLNNTQTRFGLFTSLRSVDAGLALDGADPADFKNRLDEFARDPAAAMQRSTDNYFDKPSTFASGAPANTSPLAYLRLNRGTQFRAEADLRTIDGTLKPEHRALIDKVLANPAPSAEERKQPTTPAVYGVSIITNSNPPPGLAVPGAFLIVDNHPTSGKTAAVFYSPTRGIQTFDSLQDFQDHALKQNRQALLSALSDEDADKLPSRLDGLHLGLNQLDEDVFNYSVRTQLDRHQSDTAYAFKQARERGITDLNELNAIGGNLAEPLTASFDANQIEARRDAALVEHNRPAWWKNASELDRAQLDQLERDSKRKAEAFHDAMQEKVPTLREYAAQRIKDNLQAKYPDADIDPDAIQVQSHASRAGRPLPQPSVSLTQFVLDNVKTKWDLIPNAAVNPNLRAVFTDRNGKPITLGQNDLRSLARDLNVGRGYQDLLKQRMLSAEGNELRQGWKDSHAAQMRADAKEARLSGKLDDQGYSQVMALLNHPDGLGENSEPLQVFYLTIGAGQGSRPGASIEGPMLIAKKNAKPDDPMLFYAPNAPDGENFQTYPQGMRDLKRDRRFRGDDWQAYFKNHVSENMKSFLDEQFKRGYDIFGRGHIQAQSFRQLEDTLYDAHVKRRLADTQFLSKSNQQLDAETAGDLFLAAMDIATSAADIVAPGLAAMKGLRRLLDPYKVIAGLKDLPSLATIVKKGARGPTTSVGSIVPRRATGNSALHEAAAAHRMNIVDVPGQRQPYLAPKIPDQPNGHYLLRTIDPDNEGQLVSAGIIAKPELRNGKEVWQPKVIRIEAAGANQSTPGPPSGSGGVAPSTSQSGNQAALMANFVNAQTYKQRRTAFNNLYNDFFNNVPTSTYPPRPAIPSLGKNATTTDLIDAVYRNSNGLVLGEKHNNVSSIKFLYDNLANLKRNGVNTIYVEGFDGEWITKFKTRKQRLAVDSNWDRGRYGWPYTVGNLFERAEELGIRVIGIDDQLYTNPAASINTRLKSMNYWGKTVIQMDQAQHPGKWLALVGQGHMKTSGTPLVPGLSEILGAIGVEIHPASKGIPTSISTPGEGWQGLF